MAKTIKKEFKGKFLEQIRRKTKELGFSDEEGFITYAVATLCQSATRRVSVIDVDGKTIDLLPNQNLIKDDSK